jgi:hypothetical protein
MSDGFFWMMSSVAILDDVVAGLYGWMDGWPRCITFEGEEDDSSLALHTR